MKRIFRTLIFAVGIAFSMSGLLLILPGPDSVRKVIEPINRWIQTLELDAVVLTGALLLSVGISLCLTLFKWRQKPMTRRTSPAFQSQESQEAESTPNPSGPPIWIMEE
ncbi:MAG: hypothetical protein ACE5NA_10845 [Nitrospiraceae bacterium]